MTDPRDKPQDVKNEILVPNDEGLKLKFSFSFTLFVVLFLVALQCLEYPLYKNNRGF